MEMDRRTVLALLGGAIAIPTTLFAMRNCEGPVDDEDPDSGWALLERMREALKASPDHLAARADAVVAKADPQAVFAFVRDEIVSIPQPTTWNSHGIRWGAQGALRSGMGTHLEKSALLRDLLSKVGVEAKIVAGSLPSDFDRARLGLNREPPAFDPGVSTETLRTWLQALGSAATPPPQDQADKPYDLDALAARLSIAFDEGSVPSPVNWKRALARMSLVQIQGDADAVWLNPNVMDAVWGQHYLRAKPRPTRRAKEVPQVSISVEIAGDDRPYWPESVLEASWPLPQVLGSQVRLGFTPPGSPESLAGVSANELTSFVPYLDVRGPDQQPDEPLLSEVGSAFTLGGQVVPRARAERVATQVTLATGEPASVASLELHAVRRAGYPRLALEAWPRDANGKVVWGLSEDAFVLTENGQPRNMRVERNQPRPPRVFFAFDASGSMPKDYRSRVATKKLLRRIIASVRVTHPDAEFNVAGLGNRDTLLHTRSGWIQDEEVLVAHVDTHFSSSSDAWSALVGAVSTNADVAILVSDATSRESTDLHWTERFLEGSPALIWATRQDPTDSTEVLDAMAERTKGKWFWGHKEAGPMLKQLSALLPAQDHEQPYVLSFTSEPGESTAHPGELAVRGRDVRMPFQISVPSEEARKPATKDELTGIHVRIAVGSVTVTRLIAGLPARSKASQDPFTDAVRADIRRALFGSYQFAIEGGPPTTSALLDTVLRAHLAKRPFIEAVQAKNYQRALVLAADPRIVRIPASYAVLQAPVSGAAGRRAYPEGHQIVMHSVRPSAAGTYEHECDVLPTFSWQALHDDRQDARRTVQRVSLELARREASLYHRSTLKALGSSPLKRMKIASNGAIVVPSGTPLRNRWRSLGMRKVKVSSSSGIALVPASLEGVAWWSVDRQTGTTLGMLPRGAGGGVAETEATFDAASRMIDVYDFAFGKLGIGLGVWAKLEQAKLKHLKLATLAIIKMDGSVTLGDFQALAAEQIKDELIGGIRGKVEDRLKDWMPPFATMQDMKAWAEAGEKALRLTLGPAGS